MPIWALIGFAATVCGVGDVLVVWWVLHVAADHDWTLGYTALWTGLAAMVWIVVVLVAVSVVLRSIDRRTR